LPVNQDRRRSRRKTTPVRPSLAQGRVS
jgi:hypothetical protein